MPMKEELSDAHVDALMEKTTNKAAELMEWAFEPDQDGEERTVRTVALLMTLPVIEAWVKFNAPGLVGLMKSFSSPEAAAAVARRGQARHEERLKAKADIDQIIRDAKVGP
jgi:hypothetical protein